MTWRGGQRRFKSDSGRWLRIPLDNSAVVIDPGIDFPPDTRSRVGVVLVVRMMVCCSQSAGLFAMVDLNPYQPPQEFSGGHVEPPAGDSFPANQCPSCGTKITLWMSLWQATPFRFKCSTCRAGYLVSTPRMKLAFAIFVAGLAIQTSVIVALANQTSLLTLIPGGLLYLGTIALAEVWTHRRILRHGRLIPLTLTRRITE